MGIERKAKIQIKRDEVGVCGEEGRSVGNGVETGWLTVGNADGSACAAER